MQISFQIYEHTIPVDNRSGLPIQTAKAERAELSIFACWDLKQGKR